MARVRVHQHVNPLSPFYRQDPQPIDVTSVFGDAAKPLLLDIGCARGRFLLRMAEIDPTWNYLGIEIRQPLVDEANRLASEAGHQNLYYHFGNAMLWLKELIANIPKGMLQMATIQFPDPWFKKKHAKRRMVNEEMVTALAEKLAENGRVFVQTDIDFLADEMFSHFRADDRFVEIPANDNPMPAKTEREIAVEDKDLPVYRSIFRLK